MLFGNKKEQNEYIKWVKSTESFTGIGRMKAIVTAS